MSAWFRKQLRRVEDFAFFYLGSAQLDLWSTCENTPAAALVETRIAWWEFVYEAFRDLREDLELRDELKDIDK